MNGYELHMVKPVFRLFKAFINIFDYLKKIIFLKIAPANEPTCAISCARPIYSLKGLVFISLEVSCRLYGIYENNRR